jgi:serine-type D-Ala-D-Ala carboxypeptidase (penicillin-binding protein 5/6)
MAGSFRRSGPRHSRRRSRRRLRNTAAVVVLLVVLAGAVLIRAETKALPALKLSRALPASVLLPGGPPAVAWPRQGEAAVEVSGLGSLGTFGPATPVPIASVAKVMTAYVVLKDHPLSADQSGFTITITRSDVADYTTRLARSESVVPVAAGETLTEVELLEGLLVASGNNIAPILAEHDAATLASFVSKMNDTARGLGMIHTTYTDPSGVDPTTTSNASDQVLLAEKAMVEPVFAQIVGMTSVTLPVAGTLANFNRAVGTNGFVGIKTGSDSSSGGCLLFADRQRVTGRTVLIIGAVLGQDQGATSTAVLISASISAATAVVRSVASAISPRTVLPAGSVVAYLTNAQGRRAPVTTSAPLTVVGWGGLPVPLDLSLARIGHHLAAGQAVGTVAVASGEGSPVSATASSGLPQVGLSWRLLHIF